ncbi:MAG: hypothetical protein AAFY72_05210 [Cyanobacteria bacterium J06649_4]
MKSMSLIKLFAVLSAVSTFTTPALAQSPTLESLQQTVSKETTLVSPKPSSREVAELVVVFPSNIRVETSDEATHPMTLFLAQDIIDNQGNLIAPVNSPVRAQLTTTEDGVIIVADSILASGQSISLRAVSSLIPGTTIKNAVPDSGRRRQAGVFDSLAGGIAGALGADLPTLQQARFGGNVLGYVVGESSEPQQVREVMIPAGTVHILSVD